VREGDVPKSDDPYTCPICGQKLEKLHDAHDVVTLDVDHEKMEMYMIEHLQDTLEEETPETLRVEVSPKYD
jgi:hypothetical protein